MSELTTAIKQICEEKGLSYEAVIATIESALAAAYRKDFGQKNQNIQVEFDPETVKSKVYDVKTVVEDLPEELLAEMAAAAAAAEEEAKPKAHGAKAEEKPAPVVAYVSEPTESEGEEERKFNPKTEIQLTDAKEVKKSAKVGDEIRTKLETPAEYGRMAAQTAKQVIIQRLREAERELIFNDFKTKEHEVVSGVVQRREGKMILVDLGRAVGVLPAEEAIGGETYRPGDRIKVYVKEVSAKPRGPEIVLSRTSDEILKKVFFLEIPEIANGLIEIKSVAREAGYRSKVAVWTDSDNVDPIGSCVGQRGARIQTVISELGGEKVDIILFDDEAEKFIANALSPAKIVGIDLDPQSRRASVKVNADQLSLAIGKGGQNARLAAKLTGWRIDIVEHQKPGEPAAVVESATPEDGPKTEEAAGEEGAIAEETVETVADEAVKEEPVAEETSVSVEPAVEEKAE